MHVYVWMFFVSLSSVITAQVQYNLLFVTSSVTSFGWYLLCGVIFHVLLQFVEVVEVNSLHFYASCYIYIMEVQHPL